MFLAFAAHKFACILHFQEESFVGPSGYNPTVEEVQSSSCQSSLVSSVEAQHKPGIA